MVEMEGDKGFTIRDKRRSSGTQEEQPPTAGPAENEAGSQRTQSSPPPINFSTFVLSLSTSAAMNLSGFSDPAEGTVPKNLELAKQSIDLLGILQEKTKGNLDPEEQRLLESAIYELRMQYVEEVKKKGA